MQVWNNVPFKQMFFSSSRVILSFMSVRLLCFACLKATGYTAKQITLSIFQRKCCDFLLPRKTVMKFVFVAKQTTALNARSLCVCLGVFVLC